MTKTSAHGVSPLNDEPTDPFDIDALRVAPPSEIQVEKVLTNVAVRKPARHEFFRVHPSPEYALDCFVLTREEGFERQTWWVAPRLRNELGDDVQLVRLFTWVTRRGTVSLWPARLPSSIGGGNRWYASALEVAEAAKTFWVKMAASREERGYALFKATGNLGEPNWPDKTFRELVEIGFNGCVIDRHDHDVLKEMRGEL